MTSSAHDRPGALRSLARWARLFGGPVELLLVAALLGLVSRRRAREVFGYALSLAARRLDIHIDVVDDNPDYTEPPYLLVQLNQQSLLDIIVWAAAMPRPCRTVANVGFLLLPVVGWATAATGVFPVIRSWRAQAVRSLQRAEAYLRAGGTVAVSIEGKRSPGGARAPFKKGPVMMAVHTGATLVPVSFHGTGRLLPYGDWRPRPGRVRAHLHPVIETRDLEVTDRDALLARLEALADRVLDEPPGSQGPTGG